MKLAEPQIRRWTLDEYYKLADEGYFADQRVMLIDGEIIEMPAQGHAHVKSVHQVVAVFERVFGAKHWVRCQAPMNVGRRTDPEPDVAVAAGPISAYVDHPDSALLVVEVSDSTLTWDRREIGLYASAAVEEYWIVNLEARQLEIYREPVVDRKHQYGHTYKASRFLSDSETIAPLAAVDMQIRVAELLP